LNTSFALGTGSFKIEELEGVTNDVLVPLYFTIEKFGRRQILLYGAIALSILMLLFIILLGLPEHLQSTKVKWAAVSHSFTKSRALRPY
jgi:hypothetical protein